jgi:hypothetical protein
MDQAEDDFERLVAQGIKDLIGFFDGEGEF